MFASSLLPPLLKAKGGRGRRGVFRSRSLGGAASLARCSNFSVRRRHHPSLPPSLGPSVVVSAFFHSIDLPSAVSLSFHACALPFLWRERDRGREGLCSALRRRRCSRRPPGRRRLPSSFFLNTERDRAPSDQVRSRCSLVCSLGWMDGTWKEQVEPARSLECMLDPFSSSSSFCHAVSPACSRSACSRSVHQLRLCLPPAGAWWCHRRSRLRGV